MEGRITIFLLNCYSIILIPLLLMSLVKCNDSVTLPDTATQSANDAQPGTSTLMNDHEHATQTPEPAALNSDGPISIAYADVTTLAPSGTSDSPHESEMATISNEKNDCKDDHGDACPPSTTNNPLEVADVTDNPEAFEEEPRETEKDSSATVSPKDEKNENTVCIDDNYCLNGGTCVLSASGLMLCLCPEEFYGERCQTRNMCKTIIVDSLTGDQVCAKIDRPCLFQSDKFFRCSCHDDEYFIFKTNQPQASTSSDQACVRYGNNNLSFKPSLTQLLNSHVKTSHYSYNAHQSSLNDDLNKDPSCVKDEAPSYFAECRKIDKCLGVRCRQLSEVCKDGECVCNQESGYIKDPTDDMCKLLDPCKMPTPNGLPICGQAQCIATFDEELFRCVCPVGYRALKVGSGRDSIQCALLTDTICNVPLLNKCQHICLVDRIRNNYKCSCLPGYRPGPREGIDDHLCFFEEHLEPNGFDYNSQERSGVLPFEQARPQGGEYVYKSYLIPKRLPAGQQTEGNKNSYDNTIAYDPVTTLNPDEFRAEIHKHDESDNEEDENEHVSIKKLKTYETYIKRELRVSVNGRDGNGDAAKTTTGRKSDLDNYNGLNIAKMSAQDKCNMYCEENKICVLDSGTTDSYRCQCDRQGYVSVGDRCLDWCAAAEFSYNLLSLLEMVCWSGVCKPTGPKPSAYEYSKLDSNDIVRLEQESSWRPTFECDCSSSPLLVQDPDTKLCKLDFQAVLQPCLPGNIGYKDCVEHKNAYCAVLHKNSWAFIRDLQKERPDPASPKNTPGSLLNTIKTSTVEEISRGGANKAKIKATDKLYTCVCSPEKKFLVDKPRNKERCVDECDLLNVECNRFNRMCRTATIAPEDFGHGNLVRVDLDGVRMNFKRTGCECLPGFNVGPSELVDFTLDDNNPSNAALSLNNDVYPPAAKIVYDLDSPVADQEHLRAKYMNINSRCLLDYDVVEFHASFKAPSDFDPNWIKIRNASPVKRPLTPSLLSSSSTKKLNTDKKPDARDQNKANGASDLPRPTAASEADGAINDSFNSSCEVLPDGKCVLSVPEFMRSDISELNKHIVLVAQCHPSLAPLSLEAYQECIRYRYWIVQKLRNHFIDWRRVLTAHLGGTFDLMDGNIRLRVNKCEATLRSVITPGDTVNPDPAKSEVNGPYVDIFSDKQSAVSSPNVQLQPIDPIDQRALIDADIDCELTLHSAGDESSPRYARKVLLEKQLQKFIFVKSAKQFGPNYYLMAPNMLIRRESFDQLAEHRKLFNPCKSDYAYCDKQTKCEMVDTVNFTCTCEYGYTPIGSRDIYYADSRKEVCEDINECLFDVCKELANVSTCINEIGDYRCQCNRHYTGDNKRYCTHVCNTIPCKHGKCRLVDDHHAFCECEEGYKETDCSVQDPSVALRKANMIICGSIGASVLLLAITIAISLNSQLKKTKKKLKRMEAANEAAHLFEFPTQQIPPNLSLTSNGALRNHGKK